MREVVESQARRVRSHVLAEAARRLDNNKGPCEQVCGLRQTYGGGCTIECGSGAKCGTIRECYNGYTAICGEVQAARPVDQKAHVTTGSGAVLIAPMCVCNFLSMQIIQT